MSESYEILFFTDSHHTNTYLYEPPMSIEQYLEPIDARHRHLPASSSQCSAAVHADA